MKINVKEILTILIMAAVLTGIYFATLPEDCGDFECFQSEMVACSKATYINNDPKTLWKYEIIGRENDECDVEVTLLSAKEGKVGIDKYEGHSMICSYPTGVSNYPENDLSRCHGRLKEDMQEVIIERFHAYVLENLGDIQDALDDVSLS
jgi:hypothetical protein